MFHVIQAPFYRILDGLLPIVFFITSCIIFSISRYQQQYTVIDENDCLRLPTSKTISVFKRSLVLLVVTLLEISSWAFLFAWRLESAILERSKESTNIPPLYQVVDPGLAFIPRVGYNIFCFCMNINPSVELCACTSHQIIHYTYKPNRSIKIH